MNMKTATTVTLPRSHAITAEVYFVVEIVENVGTAVF